MILEISYRRGGWGAHTVHDDALTDLGPHLVDLARWLTGADVTEVRRAVVTPERAEFDLGLGAARARIRCVTDRPHHERIEVRHRDGGLVGRLVRGGLLAAVRGRLGPRGPHPLVASLTAQLEAFARAVRGPAAPVSAGPRRSARRTTEWRSWPCWRRCGPRRGRAGAPQSPPDSPA